MSEYAGQFRSILEQMVAMGASDLHLKIGAPPTFRIDGTLFLLDMPGCRSEDLEALATQLLTPAQLETFGEEHELDLAVSVAGLARFRVNLCRQRGTLGLSLRLVPTRIPSLDELNLPAKLGSLVAEPNGLILVTGATGVGKSTTIAAMIDHLNHAEARKVVTVEDPIEYLHKDDRCLIYQREVNEDTVSFHHGLRHVLRQDPDVILIGEVRDRESLSIALTAANTGHLVLSTLHTIDSVQTIQRILSFFAPHEQEEIRRVLADNLRAIISQRLVPRIGGHGRVPAVEILVNTPTVKDYILEPVKTPMIRQLIQEGVSQYGMQSFDQALANLVHQGVVAVEDAMRFATRPNELALHFQGIEDASDRAFTAVELTALQKSTKPGTPNWIER